MNLRKILPLLFVSIILQNAKAESVQPRVVFPEGYQLPAAPGLIGVEVAWLQLELPAGWLLTAPRGARFALEGVRRVEVIEGVLTLVDPAGESLLTLPPGVWPLDARGIETEAQGQTERELLGPGYRLSDAVLTQQQKYLDSLKVDVRDINKGLASIIRGLFGRR